MKNWVCKVCGYTHVGDEAPERCPECGALKFEFAQRAKGRGCVLGAMLVLGVMSAVCYAFCSCQSSSQTVDNSTVKKLAINQFLGKWYEVARFDHRFERGMRQCTAVYTLLDDGTIKVTNKGVKDGKWKTSVGRVKLTEDPGLLRVSFFRPFYSDYRILMVSPEYSYALIGGSSDKYLWILSRNPQLKKEIRHQILNEARRRGYDTDKLVWVEQ